MADAAALDVRTLLARTWRENRLFAVLVELTYRCNLDCVFCYNDLSARGRALAREDYERFFRDLAELGVLNLTLSGGEPLAHPDFFHLGRTARELGFVVRVKSNGHALRGPLARRLRDEVDPYQVEVSLHGARAETHDRQTRVPGSFDRLLANLREMTAVGLRVKINSTLTIWNEGEVEGMYALADGLGLRLQIDPEVTPRDDGDRSPLALTPSREGVLNLFRYEFARGEAAAAQAAPPASANTAPAEVVAIGARQADADLGPRAPEKHCGAGSSGIAVDPFGNVYPCVQWRRPVGNLHESSIAEIWAHSRGLNEIRELTQAVKRTLDGEADAAFFNFCPGLAAGTSGDPLEVYEGARNRATAIRQVIAERSDKKPSPLPILR